MIEQPNKSDGQSRRILIVVFGFFLMLFAGMIYSWSIFINPIESELGFPRKETALVFTISLSISIIGQITAGALKRKFRTTVVFGIPASLFLSGFFLASRITNIYALYLSYGAMVGFAIGMIYNAVLAYTLDQFPQKQTGVVSGALLMGFGMGGMILGTLATYLINQIGWRSVFAGFGATFSLLSLAAIFVYRTDEGSRHFKDTANNAGKAPKEMVSSFSYVLLFLWFLSTAAASLTIIGHSAPIASDLGANSYLAAVAAGLVSVLNGLSRVIFGRLYEVLGQKKMKLILTLISVSAGVACFLGFTVGSLAVVLIGYMLAGLENGGNAVYAGTLIKERYGQKNYGINLGITNVHIIMASFLGNGLAGQIRTASGNYQGALMMMLGFGLISLLLFFVTARVEKAEHTLEDAQKAEQLL